MPNSQHENGSDSNQNESELGIFGIADYIGIIVAIVACLIAASSICCTPTDRGNGTGSFMLEALVTKFAVVAPPPVAAVPVTEYPTPDDQTKRLVMDSSLSYDTVANISPESPSKLGYEIKRAAMRLKECVMHQRRIEMYVTHRAVCFIQVWAYGRNADETTRLMQRARIDFAIAGMPDVRIDNAYTSALPLGWTIQIRYKQPAMFYY